MSVNVAKKDMEILESLARHRLLSVRQMAALHFSSLQMVRRKRKELEGQGLVKMIPRGYGKSGGRPELLVTLAEAGIERLQEKSILQHSVKPEQILIPDSFPARPEKKSLTCQKEVLHNRNRNPTERGPR